MARNTAIDTARGFALFMVVLSHVAVLPHYLTDFYIVTFFFLSGYLYKPGRSWGENVSRKANRLLMPYFVHSFILLAVAWAYKSFSTDFLKESLTGILYSRFRILPHGETIMVSWNYPMWYLTAYFTASLLFHAIVDYCVRSWKVVFAVSVLLISASMLLTHLPILLPWSIDLIPLANVVMIAGYLFRKHAYDFSFRSISVVGLLAAYVALCYVNGGVNLSVRSLGWLGGAVAAVAGICMTMALLTVAGSRFCRPLNRVLVPIGTHSVEVLAYHAFFLYLVKYLVTTFCVTWS